MDDFTRSMLSKGKEDDDLSKYEAYEPPMLVFIYQIGGVLSFIGGFVAPIAVGMSHNLPALGASIFGGIIGGVGMFGVAQVVDLCGRTEFHARKLHAIEAHLERIVKS